MGTESFTPLSSTAWLLTGMPALTSNRQARAVSGVISCGMVEVRLNPDLAGRLQQLDQLRIEDPLRQRHRHARADADHIEVFDGRQFGDEPAQLRHRQRERIAAGDDDVVNFVVLAHVVDHPLIVVAGAVPAVAVHGHALARAEPAVHRADVRGDHQHPVGIAMRQARDRRILVFFQRIFELLARLAGHSSGEGTDCSRIGSCGSATSISEK